MKTFFLIHAIFLISCLCKAQNHDIVEITPVISKQIKAAIESKIPGMVARLKQSDDEITEEEIEFDKDTFRIEQYEAKCINYNWSTAGMISASTEAANRYDTLMNKYYKMLKEKLKPEDREILAAAQHSWLDYRQNDLKLTGVLQGEKYGNGGTMASVINAAEYTDFVKSRAIRIFEDYMNISADEEEGGE